MSYQVLARKWRPKDFGSLVGQEHVVRALRHALEQKRLHHAYLFTGTRGVGKTTLARILAKCLNCETGITAQPCNKCSACAQIDAGRFLDLRRARRGVEPGRRRDDASFSRRSVYAPTRGPVQGLRHRRGAPALGPRLQRHAEDAGGAARAPQVHPRDDRSAEDPGHGAQPLPAVQPQADAARRDPRPSRGPAQGREDLLRGRGAVAHRSRRRGQHARRAVAARPGDRARRRQGCDGRRRRDAGGDRPGLPAAPARERCCRRCGGRSRGRRRTCRRAASPSTRRSPISRACCSSSPLRNRRPKRSKRICRNARACSSSPRSLDPETVQLCYQIALQGREDLPLAPDEHGGFVMTILQDAGVPPRDRQPRASARGEETRGSGEACSRRREGDAGTGRSWCNPCR